MEFVPVTDVAEVMVRYDYLNQQCENTLYFYYDAGAINASALQNLTGDLATYWVNEYMTDASQDCSLREIYAIDLSSAIGPSYTYNTGFPVSGGDLNPGAPGGTTLCISFRTVARGRSFRGRNYFVGLPKTALIGNTVSSVKANSILATYQGMVGGNAISSNWTWGVVSRIQNGVPREEGIFTPIIAASLVNYDVDSQRRRLAGRGA